MAGARAEAVKSKRAGQLLQAEEEDDSEEDKEVEEDKKKDKDKRWKRETAYEKISQIQENERDGGLEEASR